MKEYLIDKEHRKLMYSFTNAIFITIYMIIASLSMGYAKLAKKESRSSLGGHIFDEFLDKYISYIKFFTWLWVANLAHALYQINHKYQ